MINGRVVSPPPRHRRRAHYLQKAFLGHRRCEETSIPPRTFLESTPNPWGDFAGARFEGSPQRGISLRPCPYPFHPCPGGGSLGPFPPV